MPEAALLEYYHMIAEVHSKNVAKLTDAHQFPLPVRSKKHDRPLQMHR